LTIYFLFYTVNVRMVLIRIKVSKKNR